MRVGVPDCRNMTMIPNRLSASYPWVMMTMKLKLVRVEATLCGKGEGAFHIACGIYLLSSTQDSSH